MERVANSTPMVDFESRLNSLRVKRESRLDLPTPESPMRTTWGKRCQLWVWGNGVVDVLERYEGVTGTFKEKLNRLVVSKRSVNGSRRDVHRTRRWPYLRCPRTNSSASAKIRALVVGS